MDPMSDADPRPGEVVLGRDPAAGPVDAGLVFVGWIRTPWATREACPKNPREARERGGSATLEFLPAYRPGLAGLEGYTHAIALYWLHAARRDVIVAAPRHLAAARGVFALRSPVRPNPIGLSVVRVLAVDVAHGHVTVEPIDCLDGTPLIDVKPYLATIDAKPDAVAG
jgi:tRNA (adenine37-N6)-methyltransferase